ncbi:MacS family sensor histidine kinase [Nocardia sp. 348MFTsu5.1]|uniref:MacS family sensor histidine kinase n=1 Tax=Nocardia sp. 348MFTsu5.1 TaxID=1172185 RepID=UPI0003A75A76|nr:DUF5931 domain-containing protein [Nocardia sp. 348MFTsu5.1]
MTRSLSASGRSADTDDDPVGPLWRAAQVFRLLSYVYALGFQLAVHDDYERVGWSWFFFALLTLWTGVSTILYLKGPGRRPFWVGMDLVIACGLILVTRWLASPQWAADNQSFPTTLWATNSVVSAAILSGPVVGAGFALAVRAASAVAKGGYDLNVGRDATVVVLLAVGIGVGLAAQAARRNHERITRALRLAAAASERDRLSRQVHDGVLQVLALISRRGAEIGGETAQLARIAGEQERSLRRLIADIEPPLTDQKAADVDLRMLLRPHADDLVTISEPGEPVLLDHFRAMELEAAVVNALDNVRLHAGAGARAYVLVEDLGDQVVVSVRDDGSGIEDGRLREARAQGRMGVSRSIVERIEALGGTAKLDTGPGEGTEWELTVSKHAGDRNGEVQD